MQNIEVKTINDLLSNIDRLESQFDNSTRVNGFIFRGQRDSSYGLLPGMFRSIQKPKGEQQVDPQIEGKIYSCEENEILAHFRKEASGLLNSVSQSDDLTWMLYAQHYGVPTRLLDFTRNPLVALYFCCRDETLRDESLRDETPRDGAIWVLNRSSYMHWVFQDPFCMKHKEYATNEFIQKEILKSMKNHVGDNTGRIEMKRPLMFHPAYIDQRMVSQASIFLLWAADSRPLEEMITSSEEMYLSANGVRIVKEKDTRFLCKFIILNNYKHDILRKLELMGISEKTIFPGLDGIGKYIERFYRRNPDDEWRRF